MRFKFPLILISIYVLISIHIFPKTLINTNKIAKVGNEIILKTDVERYAKNNYLSFENSKQALINFMVLYAGAKIYGEEPSDEIIENQIKKDKAYYASLAGKEIKEITDEEFLSALHYNNLTMTNYKKELKKKLWVNTFVNNEIKKAKIIDYKPTREEIETYIKKNPHNFEEQEGAYISMIYFTYYNENGTYITNRERDIKVARSTDCLDRVHNNEDFETLVTQYSDDLISKNYDPKGWVGFIAFDDPRITESFSSEIVTVLKQSEVGVVKKVFETQNGLYIFKINKLVKPNIVTGDQAIIKAESLLKKEYNKKLKEKVKNTLLRDLSQKLDIKIY